jgi:phosphoglycerate kinase
MIFSNVCITLYSLRFFIHLQILAMSKFQSHNFSGQKALVRVDFNVPLNDKFEITDDNRIRAAIPTIQKILKDGGSVILMSHLGRPKDGPSDKYSLKHIVEHLKKALAVPVHFAEDYTGNNSDTAKDLKPGEVLLLENLRFHKEEEKGDEAFAEKLSKLGDIYVNDAFGTAHRAHASTAIIAKFFPGDKKMFGLLMEDEILNADKVLNNTVQPFTAILGGAKVSDKIQLIESLMERAHFILIGGGMAYTFLKAQGKSIGNSLVEEDKVELAKELLEKAKAKNVNIILPPDSVVADKFDANANTKTVSNDHIPDGWMGLDIAEETVDLFGNIILGSKTILWNGPMGVFEMEKFHYGTLEIANLVANATGKGAFTLVGGGDSVAAVNKFDLADKVSYVSTGGGAMLEYFEGKELPGIAAINNN